FQPLPTNCTAVLQAAAARTRWGAITNALLTAKLALAPTSTGMLATTLTLQTKTLQTEWGQGSNVSVRVSARHSSRNWLPAAIGVELEADHLQMPWSEGEARHGELSVSASLPPPEALQLFRTNLAWTDRWTNVPGDLSLVLNNVEAPKLQLHSFSTVAHWDAP